MKKILSLTMAVIMVFSMIPTAFATETYNNPDANTEMGTDVEAVGELTTVDDDGTVTYDVEYTITIPAKLAPAGSGTVTLEGKWPSDATVTVTADESVEMLNSITNGDAKTLAVTFTPIVLAGNNTAAVSDNETVSVADISAALFGTWSGTFYYNVDYVDGASGNAGDSGTTGGDSGSTDTETGDDEVVASEGYATFSDGVTLSWDELKLEENGTKYGYTASKLTDTDVGDFAFRQNKNLTSISIPEGITMLRASAFANCTNLTSVNLPASLYGFNDYTFYDCTSLSTINYAGTVSEWNAGPGSSNQNGIFENVTATEVICSDGTGALPD